MVLQEPFILWGGARCEKLENQCPRGQYYSSYSHVLKINDHSTNPCTPGGTLQLFNKQHQVKHINSESTAELKPHSLNACGFCGAAVTGKSSSSFWGCLLVYRPNPLKSKVHAACDRKLWMHTAASLWHRAHWIFMVCVRVQIHFN